MRALVLIPMEWQGKFRRQDDVIEGGVDELKALEWRVRILDDEPAEVRTADMKPAVAKRGYNTR